jgi:inosine-uridine nucleoside N-ribohydrolase
VSTLLSEKISSVYILGGTQSSQVGKEFNFMNDSEAASTVLSSPTLAGKIKLVTADVSGSSSPCKFSEGLAEKVNNLLASIPANASSSKEIMSILDLLRRHPMQFSTTPCVLLHTSIPSKLLGLIVLYVMLMARGR